MAITMSLDNVSTVMFNHLHANIKQHLRDKATRYLLDEIDPILEEMTKDLVTKVSQYHNLENDQIKLVIAFNGVPRGETK